jgi:hypothetical protein
LAVVLVALVGIVAAHDFVAAAERSHEQGYISFFF